MNYKLLLLIIVFSIRLGGVETKSDTDPFDLTKNQKKIAELGVPTTTSVKILEQKATSLYKASDWKAAAVANEEYAKAANWLANLITAGLNPFYDADSDTRTAIYGAANRGQQLLQFEKLSNDYRRKRDRATVIQAECLFKAGEKNKAMATLLSVLDNMSATDTEYWDKARVMLYEVIEVK